MKSRNPLFVPAVWLAFLFLLMSIPGYGQTNPSSSLWYAHAANGVTGAQVYVVTIMVSNPNSFSVEAAITSFNDANPNVPMGLGLTTNCTVVDPTNGFFAIPAFSACQFTSNGSGSLTTGWVEVDEKTTTNTIGGYLAFTFWQGNQFTGFPIFTVGVSPTPICGQFSIPVLRDVTTNVDTGFAMSNPFDQSGGPIVETAQLVDGSGNVIDQHVFTMNAFTHTALFLSQLFPNTLGNAHNFVGNLVVTGQASTGDGAVATALLQQGGQYGGAPPTSNSILFSKSAKSSGLRQAGSPGRAHENITQAVTSKMF